MQDCVFCRIVRNQAPAKVVREWDDCLAFVPLNPVTPDHILVIPKVHVADFVSDPEVTAAVMRRAAELAADKGLVSSNLIASAGAAATQTVFHLHVHIVPRSGGDGLALPWTRREDDPATS
jgi:histidine triad (HIT) family protein